MWYKNNPVYSMRIQKEMFKIQYKERIPVKMFTPFHYQVLIDNENSVWLDVDFTHRNYPFEIPELYVMRLGRRWDITKVDWACGFKFKYLLNQCIFNIMHSPSGMMAHVKKKQRWDLRYL